MRTAPKDKMILVRVLNYASGVEFVAVPAMWGHPYGFAEAGWWGMDFSHTSPSRNEFADLPELRAGLAAITPRGWKPWPEAGRERKR